MLERHPHARAVLTPALPPDGRPSHAYLFHGPAGVGKREVAREFAAALLSDGAPDPAGAAERVRRGAHPDLTWVVPSGAAEMLVGDIDEPVVAAASHTPFESKRRVFVIEGADRLIEAAANKMLKTLEEPPPFAHLLLLTDRPASVLPTIASRCQHVRFDALPSAELAAKLQGVAPETARACARLALGDGERAKRLAYGRGPALRQAAENYARAALRGETAGKPWKPLLDEARRSGEEAATECEELAAAELAVTSKKDVKRVEREGAEKGRRASRRAATATLDHGLQLIGLWYRDLACVRDGAEDLAHHADRLDALREDAAMRADFRALVNRVDDTRQRLILNVNEELALEALAYSIDPALTSASTRTPSTIR
jgi:DNA polymerase III subunit delta'